jgi:protein involved in polysaccharide export with SLBB domain
MRLNLARSLLLATAFSTVAVALHAQRPTSTQAQELLRTRPDLVAQLRQRIATSGLTPDQVRARLRAEGYPENLLDAYLAGGSGRPDSLASSTDIFAAVRSLGLADSTDLETLRDAARGPSVEDADSAGLRVLATNPPRRRNVESRVADDSYDAGDSLSPGSRARREAADSGRRIFGLEVFRQATSQFDPNLSGPVDPSYRLGPGDRLVLILTGDVESAQTLEVTREGFIVIPQVGQIYVANLTLAQLDDLLYNRLGRVYSGVRRGPGATTRFSVSVARLRSNQVFVVGDVSRPGSYRVSSAGTALSALYAAGGPNENGSLRRIEIRRAGRSVDFLDVYDYLLRGDASNDPRLSTGDIVFVPVHGPRVRIVGEIARPATYELKDGETLADVVTAAGGFSPLASRRRVQIERVLPPSQRGESGRDRIVIDVTSDELASGAGPKLPVMAGDVVRVFAVAERVRDRIHVLGDVWAPGVAGFTPGMKLSDALRLAGGVKPDVYLGRVLVSRLRPDSTRIQLHSSFRDSTGSLVDDIALREDDQVEVFAVRTFRPDRYVAIAGAVRAPGRFPFREGMTIRDLALLAGGLHEGAYLAAAEIARLPDNRAGGVTATTFRVPLDSSYLFERGPDGKYLGPPGLPAPSGDAPEVLVRPYDNVLILRQPDWELQRTVFLAGEVRFPGAYALRSKSERLSDVVARAGGLTTEAYAEGVFFYRKQRQLGRIGVDLPRALREPKDQDNLVMQDGDSVVVPSFNPVVNVAGAVNSPVAVAFVRGRTIDYYIQAAGGGSRKSDLSRAYVTQPNGQVESVSRHTILPDGLPRPRPGSSVFVPERDPADRRDYVAAVTATAQIVASLVAILVVLRR